jgi:hypothetical protein
VSSRQLYIAAITGLKNDRSSLFQIRDVQEFCKRKALLEWSCNSTSPHVFLVCTGTTSLVPLPLPLVTPCCTERRYAPFLSFLVTVTVSLTVTWTDVTGLSNVQIHKMSVLWICQLVKPQDPFSGLLQEKQWNVGSCDKENFIAPERYGILFSLRTTRNILQFTCRMTYLST